MRLIDADALMDVIEKEMKKNPHKDAKIAQNHNMEHRAFRAMVALQPTIYNVDKVIEQLKDTGKKMAETKLPHNYYKAVSVKKAVGIVERGGVE